MLRKRSCSLNTTTGKDQFSLHLVSGIDSGLSRTLFLLAGALLYVPICLSKGSGRLGLLPLIKTSRCNSCGNFIRYLHLFVELSSNQTWKSHSHTTGQLYDIDYLNLFNQETVTQTQPPGPPAQPTLPSLPPSEIFTEFTAESRTNRHDGLFSYLTTNQVLLIFLKG